MHLFPVARVFLDSNPKGVSTMSKRVRRDKEGKFKESVDVSRSLSADARHDAKHDAKPGQGDKGDRKHLRKRQ